MLSPIPRGPTLRGLPGPSSWQPLPRGPPPLSCRRAAPYPGEKDETQGRGHVEEGKGQEKQNRQVEADHAQDPLPPRQLPPARLGKPLCSAKERRHASPQRTEEPRRQALVKNPLRKSARLAELRPMGSDREGEWSARKHGAWRPRRGCEGHRGIDAETPEVRAIEGEQANAIGPREPANGSPAGDGPVPPELPDQIPPEEPIGTVTADGA